MFIDSIPEDVERVTALAGGGIWRRLPPGSPYAEIVEADNWFLDDGETWPTVLDEDALLDEYAPMKSAD